MIRQSSAVVALIACAALLLGGCDNDNPKNAPTDATKAAFCSAYTALYAAPQDSSTEALRTLQDNLLHVGTPKGTPVEAREGFEYLTDEATLFKNAAAVIDLSERLSTHGQRAASLESFVDQHCDR